MWKLYPYNKDVCITIIFASFYGKKLKNKFKILLYKISSLKKWQYYPYILSDLSLSNNNSKIIIFIFCRPVIYLKVMIDELEMFVKVRGG